MIGQLRATTNTINTTINFTRRNVPRRRLPDRQNISAQSSDTGNNEDHMNDDDSFIDPENLDEPEIDYHANLHKPVHPYLSCTKGEALLAIYSYYVRHNISWVAVEHLSHLINFILGLESLPKSKYTIKKLLNIGNNEMNPVIHLQCQKCQNYLGKRSQFTENEVKTVICNICQSYCTTDIKYLKNHFVTLPLKPQLISLLRENIRKGNFINQRQRARNVICDIHDSEVYQNLKQKMRDKQFITLTLSTDGAVVHKSPRDKSLWPLQLIVNEIDLKCRFQRQNILCTAFSYGKTPDMSLLMKWLITELNEINRSGGLEMDIGESEQNERFFIILLGITMDSMAKPYVAKKTQHNSHEGCPYCHHYGTIPQGSTQVKYSFSANKNIRLHEEAKAAMLEADESGKRVRGYTGISPVLALDTPFDVVWQFPIDKMHSIDLGVVKKIFNLILGNKKEP